MFASRRALIGCVAVSALAVAAPRAAAQWATIIAVRGEAAPDTNGNNFLGFGRPAINNVGQVAFQGLMPGTGPLGDKIAGVFMTSLPAAPGVQPTLTPLVPGSNLTGTLTEVALFAAPVPNNPQTMIRSDGTVDPGTNDDPIVPGQLFTHNVFYTAVSDQVSINDFNASTNPKGAVAFQATAVTTNINSGANIRLGGIFAGTYPPPPIGTGTVSTVALVQTPAPPNPPPGVFSFGTPFPTADANHFNPWTTLETNPAQNNKGNVAFWGELNNPTAPTGFTPAGLQNGIFFGGKDQATGAFTVSTVATTGIIYNINFAGNAIPLSFDGFGTTREPAINDNDVVAFFATTTNSQAPAGIFRFDPGVGLTAVALQNQPAGGTNGNYRTIQEDIVSVSSAGSGLVAFRATLTTGPGAGDSGIFAQPAANQPAVAVAVTRDVISPILIGGFPNTPYSVLYPDGLYHSGPAIGQPVHYTSFASEIGQNALGRLVFGASLATGDGGGIFLATSNGSAYGITPIALSGNPAPGAGPGITYGSLRPTPLAINNHNTLGSFLPGNIDNSTALSPEVAFVASLAGPGVVVGRNDQALFLANDQRLPAQTGRPDNTHETETVMLARTGDQLLVAPGVTRTILDFGTAAAPGFYSSVGKGRNSINDWGQVTTVVDFRDGTSGVFVFTPDLRLRPTIGATAAISIPWGTPSQLTGGGQFSNQNFTFGYNPADQLYKVIIDPGDAAPGVTDVTVGPVPTQAVPALTVGGASGRTHLQIANGATVTVGMGRPVANGGAVTVGDTGQTNGSVVLTLQSGSGGTGFSSIGPVSPGGTAATVILKGDVRTLAGATTAQIATNLDLGNVPLPPLPPPPNLPPVQQFAFASTADVDRFRTVTVDRGNFVGGNPVDLLISGNVTSASETGQFDSPDGSARTTYTNNLHRGLIKAGTGTLQLTGINTFGPDTSAATANSGPTQTIGVLPLIAGGVNIPTTTQTDPYITSPFVQSIQVLGGELSVSQDANLGLSPGAVSPTNPYRGRWITLNGGALQATATFTIDPNRGIALGPVSGFGNGTFDVTAGSTLTYLGIVADNTDGVTTGVGTLIKNGFGTLILGKSNTYRGGTIVNQGTLIDPSINDNGLGANGTPVTVNAGATLVYAVSATTERPFTLNGGTLSVTAGNTLTFSAPLNGAPSVSGTGGTLAGPGTFATVAGGSTVLTNVTTSANSSLTLNGTDTLVAVNNGGRLTVPAATGPVALTHFNNLGTGSITVGAATGTGAVVNVSDFQSSGVLTIANTTAGFASANRVNNVGGMPLYFNAGSRTFLGTPLTGGQFGAVMDFNGQNAIVT
ncbi:MAG TPA: choice-of-anchor tandem repeat NxxGxxAF-containing protein, partial [Gemmataceae bacterium]